MDDLVADFAGELANVGVVEPATEDPFHTLLDRHDSNERLLCHLVTDLVTDFFLEWR